MTNKLRMKPLASILFLLLLLASPYPVTADRNDFVVEPYLQLNYQSEQAESDSEESTESHHGNSDINNGKKSLDIVWFAADPNRRWRLEIKQDGGHWSSSNIKSHQRPIYCTSIKPLFRYRFSVPHLEPGKIFDYRVIADDKPVFASWAMAPKTVSQDYTVDVFGDCGAGTIGQRLVAWQCYSKQKPDMVVIPGDIVYPTGRFSEYLSRFFPVYNHDDPDQKGGVPLMRSVPFVGVIGNHDVGVGSGRPATLDRVPDAFAYFYVWHPPSNGPITSTTSKNTPNLGPAGSAAPFLDSAKDEYPRAAMFSFDYANSHWLALDGNPYMDWRDPALRKWVEDDLKKSTATWKFVTFHQPGFSYDSQHAREERMRLLAGLFQKYDVDMVFAGHAHDYQRTKPLTFKPVIKDGLPMINQDGTVPGVIEFDKSFDGNKTTVPNGLIHIVTGGGGAALYGRKERLDKAVGSFDFIDKFISNVHSFTKLNISGAKLELTQIDDNGNTIDHFVVTKRSSATP